MTPKLVHQIWLGPQRPHIEFHRELAIKNPDYSVVLWRERDLIGLGVDLNGLYDKFWSHASVSNMLRLMIVKKYGGFYLDMDMEPIKPIDCLRQVYGNAAAADQGDGRICNAFFNAPPDHPWVNWQIEHGAGDCNPHDAAWGVYTMTKAPRYGLYLVPTELVYPFHYDAVDKSVGENAVLVHHWDGSWTKK